MAFQIHGHHAAVESGFGALQSYRLEVWGSNMPVQSIAVPSAGPHVIQFGGLDIWRHYNAYVYYIGEGFTVKSALGKSVTGESCELYFFLVTVCVKK